MRCAKDSEHPVFEPYSTYIGFSFAVSDAGAEAFEAACVATAFSLSWLKDRTDCREGLFLRGMAWMKKLCGLIVSVCLSSSSYVGSCMTRSKCCKMVTSASWASCQAKGRPWYLIRTRYAYMKWGV